MIRQWECQWLSSLRDLQWSVPSHSAWTCLMKCLSDQIIAILNFSGCTLHWRLLVSWEQARLTLFFINSKTANKTSIRTASRKCSAGLKSRLLRIRKPDPVVVALLDMVPPAIEYSLFRNISHTFSSPIMIPKKQTVHCKQMVLKRVAYSPSP